jgi:hypothetical protein
VKAGLIEAGIPVPLGRGVFNFGHRSGSVQSGYCVGCSVDHSVGNMEVMR